MFPAQTNISKKGSRLHFFSDFGGKGLEMLGQNLIRAAASFVSEDRELAGE